MEKLKFLFLILFFCDQLAFGAKEVIQISRFKIDMDEKGKPVCVASGVTIARSKDKKIIGEISDCKELSSLFTKHQGAEINIEKLDINISNVEIDDDSNLKVFFKNAKKPLVVRVSPEMKEKFQKEMAKYSNLTTAMAFLPQILIQSLSLVK